MSGWRWNPRQPGAQMALAEDGTYLGYLSGGCLEQSVVLEAQAAIRDGRNRLVRTGSRLRCVFSNIEVVDLNLNCFNCIRRTQPELPFCSGYPGVRRTTGRKAADPRRPPASICPLLPAFVRF